MRKKKGGGEPRKKKKLKISDSAVKDCDRIWKTNRLAGKTIIPFLPFTSSEDAGIKI